MVSTETVLYVTAAYGRYYATAQAALSDWAAGKDFRIKTNGAYCSQRDNFASVGYTHVMCIVGGDGYTTLWEKGKVT